MRRNECNELASLRSLQNHFLCFVRSKTGWSFLSKAELLVFYVWQKVLDAKEKIWANLYVVLIHGESKFHTYKHIWEHHCCTTTDKLPPHVLMSLRGTHGSMVRAATKCHRIIQKYALIWICIFCLYTCN